ncbi:hypothetical protein ABW19_dt0203723 [Dactylella cylindrospora]|nr:hypothetical protein ABW19_dt0203723 [Dactylella cylindrospora]
MRFSFVSSLLSLAAIAVPFANAQGAETNENIIYKPAANDVWSAGTPFDIEWTPSANPGTVSIILLKGLQTNLQVVETIAPNVANNGKFQWNPPLYLEGMQTMPADHIYGFKIVTDATGNYGWSPPFKLNSPLSTFNAASTGTTEVSSTETAATTASTELPTSTTSSETLTTSTEISSTTSASLTSSTETPTSTSASSTESSTTESSTLTSSTASSTAASTTTESTTSASETAAAATETESETESPSASAAPSSSGGLSTYAIAGISASAVAAVALGILAFFLVRRKKRSNRQRLVGGTGEPSKYDKEFQMMERRAKHRPTSSFGFNTSRSDTSGMLTDRNDPYVPLDDRQGYAVTRDSGTWNGGRFI